MKKENRILITGASGFLGQQVTAGFRAAGYRDLVTFRSSEYDLTKETEVERLFRKAGPFNGVIHLAAATGGIGFNRKSPASIYYKNIMMNTLMQEYSLKNKVGKFLGVGSVCEYPKFTKVPFTEDDLWQGYPEETNALYGLAKKMMLVQGQGYRQQYGFNAVHLLLANMYGPGDKVDLEDSHIIPAVIRKCITAKEAEGKNIVCWGDGSPTREFLYVEDAAKGIFLAFENYNKAEPVNLGAGFEVSIKDTVELIVKLIGFQGEVIWDKTKPNGQLRRCLDINRAKKEFAFEAKVKLEDGIKRTIDWYRSVAPLQKQR